MAKKPRQKVTPTEDVRLLIINLRRVLHELETRYDVPRDSASENGWDFVDKPQSADETHYHPVRNRTTRFQMPLSPDIAELVENFNKKRRIR